MNGGLGCVAHICLRHRRWPVCAVMRVLILAAALLGLAPLSAGAATRAATCPLPIPAWLGAEAMPLPLARARLADRPVLKIVTIGSSSTQGIGASGPQATYPVVLEGLLREALPGVRVKVINRGIGGEDAAQNIARFGEDVLPLRPAIVIWQAGANMAMRQGEPRHFRTLLDRGVEVLKNEGVEVILVDSQAAPRVLQAPRNAQFIAAVRETAQDQETGLFPRFALMQGWQQTNPEAAATLVGSDQLHHTDAGYACMAQGLAAMILAGLR
jgi:acyl-CoA thioesterase-1